MLGRRLWGCPPGPSPGRSLHPSWCCSPHVTRAVLGVCWSRVGTGLPRRRGPWPWVMETHAQALSQLMAPAFLGFEPLSGASQPSDRARLDT